MAEEQGNMTMAILAMTVLFAVFGGIVFALMRMTGGEEAPEEPKQKGKDRKRGALDKMKRDAAADNAEEDGEEDENDDDGGDDGGRNGRRNAAKDDKKQEKKAQAEGARQARQQKDQQVSEKSQKYNQKQSDRDAERLKKEEEEKQAEEEKMKAEQEEFSKWKDMFAVEAEGEEDSGTADGGAVERFIDYVKVRKVVNLEDLAADFRMRTSVAIERLKELEKLGRISGIFDDRGKFVYITAEEMAGVSEWLKNKGRINRADLVAACNKIVRLNPTEEDKSKLQKEASAAVDALDDGEAAQEAES